MNRKCKNLGYCYASFVLPVLFYFSRFRHIVYVYVNNIHQYSPMSVYAFRWWAGDQKGTRNTINNITKCTKGSYDTRREQSFLWYVNSLRSKKKIIEKNIQRSRITVNKVKGLFTYYVSIKGGGRSLLHLFSITWWTICMGIMQIFLKNLVYFDLNIYGNYTRLFLKWKTFSRIPENK